MNGNGLKAFFGVNEEGYRAVIDQFDLHGCLKPACGDRYSPPLHFFDETLVNGLGVDGRSGIGISGPSSLAAVSVESKLRDNKHFFTEIQQRTVHFPLIVIKDPQIGDLVDHPLDFCGSVGSMDSDKNHKTTAD